MVALFLTFLFTLNIQVEQTVSGLTIAVLNKAGRIVRELPAPSAGAYSIEDIEPGTYTLRVSVESQTLTTISDVVVPSQNPVVVDVSRAAPSERPQAGAQRNDNIQINLIDNNALVEQLSRQGVDPRPVTEFSASRNNYGIEFGGLGRNLDIIESERQNAFHGEVFERHQNSVFNARTFFQVGDVKPSRRNQYGFMIGGLLGRGDRLSFSVSAEEVRQSGFVNGNVLVPLANERAPRTNDPALRAVISRYLAAYPKELPNRTEIDPRMLNTNAMQAIRTSGGMARLDWTLDTRQSASLRYSGQDTFIDSFEFVAGLNPNQRLRPQTVNLSATRKLRDRAVLRAGANFLRRKIHLLMPPGAVGPYTIFAKQIEDLGPRAQFPILRAQNEFEYLAMVSSSMTEHQLDWGAEIRRIQVNDLQSDDARGVMVFSPNFGRSSVENLLLGLPTNYRLTIGNLYRGFRFWDAAFFLNDRVKLTNRLQMTLGVRYESAGAPGEVNGLTTFPYRSDRNNVAPRIGLSYSLGQTAARAGYGIAYGRVFPAAFQISRFNPPDVIRPSIQNPDLLNPLRDFLMRPGEAPRSALNVIDPDLAVPYSQYYTVEVERSLPSDLRVTAAWAGSRTWKLFHLIHGNRALRPAGMPIVTANINERRPDPRYYGVYRLTNIGRAYYDAAILAVEKKLSHGLSFRSVYAWSKTLDMAAHFASTAVNDDEVREQETDNLVGDMKAASKFDAPHSLVLTYAYELPGPFKGWTVSGTTLFRSGTPFTVETGSDVPPFGNVDGEWQDRPTIVDTSLLGRSVDSPDSSQSILRRQAFRIEDVFVLGKGNLGRNTFRKDGGNNFNLAISRSFRLPMDGTQTANFRAEAINLVNHAQFDAPNFNLSSPSFGQITTTTNSGRILQFSLQVRF